MKAVLYALRSFPSGADLFPRTPPPARSGPRRAAVAVGVAAVLLGAVVLLFRVAGVPSWNSVYAEDRGIFLVQALAHPWDLLVPYNGYLEFLPRLLAQIVSLLPLTWAAVVFAWAGALIASACALFVYHASSGYIRSRALRAVLALALLLLPVAPLELVDNGVNTPWYLIIALFWAALWRPGSRSGKAVSALIAFVTVLSSPLAAVVAPLLAARLLVLRPSRQRGYLTEHWVTAGWLLGWPIQLYVTALTPPGQRSSGHATVLEAAGYWTHTVVLRAFGWHLSWDLVRLLGTTGATVACGAVLAVLLGLAWLRGGRTARVLIPLGLVMGFLYTTGAALITGYVVHQAPFQHPVSFEAASRYSALPLVLIYAMLIAGVDNLARRHGGLRRALALAGGSASRSAAVPVAVAVLAAVLVPAWVTDYSYQTQRSSGGTWKPVAARYLRHCQHQSTVVMPEWTGHKGLYHIPIPCSRIVG